MNQTLIIIGIVVVVIGLFAGIYTITTTEEHVWGLFTSTETSSPYANLSLPVLIGGIILIIVGAFVGNQKNK